MEGIVNVPVYYFISKDFRILSCLSDTMARLTQCLLLFLLLLRKNFNQPYNRRAIALVGSALVEDIKDIDKLSSFVIFHLPGEMDFLIKLKRQL